MPTTTIEKRFVPVKLRAETDESGKRVIRGYTAKFNSDSLDLGGFTERILPGAFTEVLESSPDVRALYNHNPDHVLGRTTAGTLTMKEDSTGLYIEAYPPDTEIGRSVHESIRRGDISGMSFAFSDVDDEWNEDLSQRTIKRIGSIYDVGPVTYPAYPDTSAAVRSRDIARNTESQNASNTSCANVNDPCTYTLTIGEDTSINLTPINITIPGFSDDENEARSAQPKPQKRTKAMNPRELREKAERLLEAANGIKTDAQNEERSLTDEEMEDIEAKLAKRQRLIKEAETLEKLKSAETATQAEERKVTNEVHEPEIRNQPTRREAIYTPTRRNLKAFDKNLFGGSIQNANEAAYRMGNWVAGQLFNWDKGREFCRLNNIPIDKRAQAANINAKGGYLVPDEMASAVINIMDEFGAARRVCRIHPMSGDTLRVPIRKSGLTAYFINEAADFTESDKDWDNAELVARKLGVIVKYSSEVAEDAIIDMADDLAEEIGTTMAETEDDCFLNGDGTSTYGGIEGIQYLIEQDTWSDSLLDAASSHDTLAEVDHDDLALLYGTLPQKYQRDAVWMCHPLTKASVFDALLQSGGGNQNAQLAAGQPASYMGYPIITSEKFYVPATPSTAANDKVPILFGSFRNGVSFGDRRQISVAVSDQRYWESDQLAIRGIERFDVAAHNGKPDTANSKVGAIVGLALTT